MMMQIYNFFFDSNFFYRYFLLKISKIKKPYRINTIWFTFKLLKMIIR